MHFYHFAITVIFVTLCQNGFGLSKRGESDGEMYAKYIKMPGVTPKVVSWSISFFILTISCVFRC